VGFAMKKNRFFLQSSVIQKNIGLGKFFGKNILGKIWALISWALLAPTLHPK